MKDVIVNCSIWLGVIIARLPEGKLPAERWRPVETSYLEELRPKKAVHREWQLIDRLNIVSASSCVHRLPHSARSATVRC
jgi:hypothetical protein